MVAALAMLIIGGLSVTRADSQSPTDASNPATHPVVGSWIMSDSSRAASPTITRLITFHSDGSVIFTTQDGMTSHGAWQPIGERSAEFNIIQFGAGSIPDELTRFLGTVEVLEDGDTFIRSSAIIGGDKVRGERILSGGATGVGHPEIDASPSVGD